MFKLMVNGNPKPTVTWERINGKLDDPEVFKTRYNERSKEYLLEVR